MAKIYTRVWGGLDNAVPLDEVTNAADEVPTHPDANISEYYTPSEEMWYIDYDPATDTCLTYCKSHSRLSDFYKV